MVMRIQLFRMIRIALLVLLPVFPIQAATPAADKTVLIINSYHRGFTWSDAEESGFTERLQAAYPSVDIPIEFMDTKRHPAPSNLRYIKNHLLSKYRGEAIDLVVAFDNPALDMLVLYRDELFPDVPVVFVGVSDFDQSLLRRRKRVTGVVEIQDAKNTLEMALTFHPGTKEVLVIDDTTISGVSLRREVEAMIPSFAGRVTFRFLPPSTFEEAQAEIGSLSPDTIVLITSYSTDRKGRTVSLAESTRIFTAVAKVPVYGVHETRLGHGIVGGSLLGGRDHGRRAAGLALKILAGEDPATIPVDTRGTARPMFDFVQLERFGIIRQYLPLDSIIINEPESIFTKYRTFMLGIIAVVTALGIMVMFLTAAIIRRKGAEESLRQANLVVENSPAVLFRWKTTAGWPVELVSKNITQFGYTPEELFSGLVTFASMIHPEDRNRVVSEVEAYAASGVAQFQQEYRIITKDGHVRWIDDRTAVERDMNGSPIHYQGIVIDITERKRVQEELQLTHFCVDKASIGIHRVSEEGTIEAVNEIMCRNLGYTSEELCSMTIFDIDPNFNREIFREHRRIVYSTGSRTFQTTHRRKDGSTFPVEVTVTHLKYQGKAMTISFAKDITERKQAEEALRESEARFRSVVESLPLPLAINTESGMTEYVNPKFIDMFGYRLEDIPSLDDWFRLAYPDPTYRQYLRERLRASLKRIAEGGAPIQGFEVEITCKDGSIKNAELFGGILGHKTLRIFSDITYRKRAEAALMESEQRFRVLSEASFEGIALSENGILRDVNDQLAGMLGYGRSELIGQPVTRFIAPEHQTLVVDAIRSARLEPYENLLVRKDGSTFFVESRARTIQIGDRHMRLTAIHDITERKQAESEQAKLKEQLFQSQKMETVGLLAGGVAHDFNNLLTPILGYSEMLMRALPVDDPNRLKLEYIRQAAELARGLTRRLLAFGRKQVLEFRVVKLGDVVNEFEPVLHRTIHENIQIKINTALSGGIVRVDTGQIEQVLLNLSINAQDAMPAGGVLTIETRDIDLDESYTSTHLEVIPGPYVMLAVSDTGTGMDEQTQEHIFEPFFTTKELGRGTGLGLATVYGIVKQHDGSLSVYSEKGRGSAFKIYLPRVVEQGTMAASQSRQSDEFEHGAETVLVVEDNEMVRTLACTMLQDLGYRVLMATTAAHGIEIAQQHSGDIDLLLTDVIMPKMNGKELYELLKRDRPALKVLFMSGHSQNVIGQHGVLDKGIHLLQKPFTQSALSQLVRKVFAS